MRWNNRAPVGDQPWEKYFAFTPVYLGNEEWAWFEWVERKKCFLYKDNSYFWEYRLPEVGE